MQDARCRMRGPMSGFSEALMRVLVLTSHIPFADGGELRRAHGLLQALRAAGHTADLLVLSQNRFGRTLLGYAAAALTDVGFGSGGPPDVVISLRFPCYLACHPRHVVWLCHRLREYDDLWDFYRVRWSPAQRIKERFRRWVVTRLDRWALRRAGALWAISREVAGRLERGLGLQARVLYQPPPPRPYRTDRYGPFVLWVSRMTELKRPRLAVEAMAHVQSGLSLWMVGDGPEAEAVRQYVRERGLEKCVRVLGAVSENELIRLYAECRGVLFTTYREDFGLVTVEAFASGKPVIVCRDGGGATELVSHGRNGYVVEPRPEAIARYLDRWGEDVRVAERQGEQARRTVRELQWPRVVAALLGEG
jgi:glycosyltransferase involved in cell wall biosynthesis